MKKFAIIYFKQVVGLCRICLWENIAVDFQKYGENFGHYLIGLTTCCWSILEVK